MKKIIEFKGGKMFRAGDDPEFVGSVLNMFFGFPVHVAPSEVKKHLGSGGYTLLIGPLKWMDDFLENAIGIWQKQFSKIIFETELQAICSLMECIIESKDVYGMNEQMRNDDVICYACEIFFHPEDLEADEYSDIYCKRCGDMLEKDSVSASAQIPIDNFRYFVGEG